MSGFRLYSPPTRLRQLVFRRGGRTRDDAIAQATANVETLREAARDGIAEAIDELENNVSGAGLSGERESQILGLLNRIITLASHFGLLRLREAADEFASLVLAVDDISAIRPEIARVYLDAMTLFGPDAAPCSAEEYATVMRELSRVRERVTR